MFVLAVLWAVKDKEKESENRPLMTSEKLTNA